MLLLNKRGLVFIRHSGKLAALMQLSDFDYSLPDELIAHYPTQSRSASRLLQLDRATGEISHHSFRDLLAMLTPADLLVFNDTKVLPARLLGHKASGGRIEILIERLLPDNEAIAQIRASKSPGAGTRLIVKSASCDDVLEIEVTGRQDAFFRIRVDSDMAALDWLQQFGHMPLPPYIDRQDELEDQTRYQTVYGRNPGAVAAPTAGLHFDEPLLEALRDKGVEMAFVTLHVGSGTFQPVRNEDIKSHQMHSEWVDVPASVCQQIKACRGRGGRVVAVGTTSVRSLESAAQMCPSNGDLLPFQGETDIFIYPALP